MRLLASLLLATSLLGCTASSKPAPVEPEPDPIVTPAPRLDRAEVRDALAKRRDASVARFLAYREGRVYPINDVAPGAQHVWLDSNGNLCAAATIISGDWGRDRVIEAGAADNGLQLAAVTSGPLHDWILTSGLTHHEIVAIQVPPMMPEPEPGAREAETARLYTLYVDVERQLRSLWEENLELAVDALMARPDLARTLLGA